mgnify:CR=1 FL=1
MSIDYRNLSYDSSLKNGTIRLLIRKELAILFQKFYPLFSTISIGPNEKSVLIDYLHKRIPNDLKAMFELTEEGNTYEEMVEDEISKIESQVISVFTKASLEKIFLDGLELHGVVPNVNNQRFPRTISKSMILEEGIRVSCVTPPTGFAGGTSKHEQLWATLKQFDLYETGSGLVPFSSLPNFKALDDSVVLETGLKLNHMIRICLVSDGHQSDLFNPAEKSMNITDGNRKYLLVPIVEAQTDLTDDRDLTFQLLKTGILNKPNFIKLVNECIPVSTFGSMMLEQTINNASLMDNVFEQNGYMRSIEDSVDSLVKSLGDN